MSIVQFQIGGPTTTRGNKSISHKHVNELYGMSGKVKYSHEIFSDNQEDCCSVKIQIIVYFCVKKTPSLWDITTMNKTVAPGF